MFLVAKVLSNLFGKIKEKKEFEGEQAPDKCDLFKGSAMNRENELRRKRRLDFRE